MEIQRTTFASKNKMAATAKPMLKKQDSLKLEPDCVDLQKNQEAPPDSSKIRNMANLVFKREPNKPLWSFEAPEGYIDFQGAITTNDGSLYATSESSIYKLDPKTSNKLWERNIPSVKSSLQCRN